MTPSTAFFSSLELPNITVEVKSNEFKLSSVYLFWLELGTLTIKVPTQGREFLNWTYLLPRVKLGQFRIETDK